jgi:hypothetical protein
MADSAGLCEQACIFTKQYGVTEQGSHHWQNLNSSPAQLMLPRHSVLLLAETFEMRKRLLILCLLKQTENTEAIFKNYEPFI